MYHPSQMSGESHPESSEPSGSQPYQPQSAPDPSAPAQYPQYPYDMPMRYPQSRNISQYPNPQAQAQGLPLPSMTAPLMQESNYPALQGGGMDTTGQLAPPGMKPKVTATLWEDEGTICFQVDVKGTCVARREDNHMINGTKLLNVAGMTRGRRDGILKSEKQKHVVKIGPMHLKGVWIPFERALEFANKEKITEMLYPLFVHNIGALLYHPTNPYRELSAIQMPGRRDGA